MSDMWLPYLVIRVVQFGFIEPVAAFIDRYDVIAYCKHFKSLGVDFVVFEYESHKLIYSTDV